MLSVVRPVAAGPPQCPFLPSVSTQFDTLDRPASHYGLSLARGSGEVRLRELGSAYVALGRGGEAVPLRMRASDPEPRGRRVLMFRNVRNRTRRPP